MEIIIIAAIAENNIIGKDGKIPWYSKEDFKHFKETTLGYPMLMGRKTFESIGKTLPGRKSIIVTRNSNFKYEHQDVMIFNDIKLAVDYCRNQNYKKLFIIGGAEIYRQSLRYTDKLLISHMKTKTEGDTLFPEFNNEWEEITSKNYNDFILKEYVRK